jgi:hypothetical protein
VDVEDARDIWEEKKRKKYVFLVTKTGQELNLRCC